MRLLRLNRTYPLMILALMLCRITAGGAYRNGPEIRSDGVGYHAWTRAIVERDFTFCAWRAHGTPLFSYEDPVRGICQNKYPPGLALLRLPVMAFLVDTSPGAPLISQAEQRAAGIIGAVALWCVAALCAWMLALLNVPAGRANAIVAITLFGTGIFHYGTYDGSFTHVYSALCCALLSALFVREQTRGQPMPHSAAFFCAFFLISLRTTNVFLLAALCVAQLVARRGALTRGLIVRGAITVAGAALALSLQVAYNYYVHHAFMINSYGSESFLFDRPMQREVLLSYERGLLTYQPVFGLALLCGFAIAGARGWASLLLATIAAYVTLYGFWHSWQLGGGMGHRGFVELAPLVAVTLGLAWRPLNPGWLTGLAAIGVLCTMVTLTVMIGYWNSTFPFGGATSHVYWSHVLGFDPDEPHPAPVPARRRKSAR